MTQRNDDDRPEHGAATAERPLDRARARVEAELAALGEAPADDEELAFAVDEDDDVCTVATLVALSRWPASAEPLDALARHRVWQRVAARVAEPVVDPHEPAANGGASGWRGVLASLALVAGVALVLRLDVAPPLSAADRAAMLSAGELARAQLGDAPAGERARALAEGDEARLRAARGAER